MLTTAFVLEILSRGARSMNFSSSFQVNRMSMQIKVAVRTISLQVTRIDEVFRLITVAYLLCATSTSAKDIHRVRFNQIHFKTLPIEWRINISWAIHPGHYHWNELGLRLIAMASTYLSQTRCFTTVYHRLTNMISVSGRLVHVRNRIFDVTSLTIG